MQRQGYDLLVKRAQPVPLTDKLMGTEDIRLLRACPCPVWLTRPDDLPNYNAIMAAIDYDPDQPTTLDAPLNQQILGLAASLHICTCNVVCRVMRFRRQRQRCGLTS